MMCCAAHMFVVRIASTSISTMLRLSIVTRKRAVRFVVRLAFARSIPSSCDTSRYLPVWVDLMATTSPSLGRKFTVLTCSRIVMPANTKRPAHAAPHAKRNLFIAPSTAVWRLSPRLDLGLIAFWVFHTPLWYLSPISYSTSTISIRVY